MNKPHTSSCDAQASAGQRTQTLVSRLPRTALAVLASIASSVVLMGCASTDAATADAAAAAEQTVAQATPATAAAAGPSMGNGENNWIVVDGVTRERNVLKFKEVRIDGNGWLVMHPFEDGKPNGDKYVASTYVESGTTQDVDIEVLKGVATGEMFIVMLHRDLNENQVLDFVFVDDRNVMDKAVFEGSRMIGHAIPAP